ncbi:hypothetical protein BOTCAL_0048g00120 [Botryotinia calthae]|uniref:Uncharacterized protein n=1 Tax=Botryotinia calthae TaxID=38488 RepID=A0A4Y8DBJ5_9HELO|nr:hypothetical protein BOTCAL_0048g00120 [Botryotinia calthae]
MTSLTKCDPDGDLDLIEPIAIVGLSLKFPQDATSPEAFWKMMAEKRHGMKEFPTDRMNVNAFYHPNNTRRNAFPVRGGHFIKEDLGVFDAKFFSITPAEAAAMDPAQRILLETTFRALENSGIPLEHLKGSDTAVFTGCFSNDYLLQLLKDPEQLPTYAATGASLSMLANRLSWFFDLSGPSVNLDSACSSSAMALDQACRTLHSGQSSMALVAGCNLTYFPEYTHILSNMNFLSPDNQCFTFDSRANGYARGEGIGVVVLKKLSQALKDQDTVRAVIRSTGCNQDGRTVGITQPNSKAQERLMKEVYSKAGLSMKKTRFFEAHGTGTSIGDPTEISAISGAFRKYRTRQDPLYVGAVKTNIGHLEGASGIAGLIKTILILETGCILPNTNFHESNEKIDLEACCIKLPLECTPWPSKGLRRASINSFGFGGANCHVVIDDAFHYLSQHGLAGNLRTVPEPPQKTFSYHTPHMILGSESQRNDNLDLFRTPKLLVWSASDPIALQEMVFKYQNHCSSLPDATLNNGSYVHDLAYTLDSRRSSLQWKSYVVLSSISELKDLAKVASRPVATRPLRPVLGFVFTGQGAQWHAMGRDLFTYPIFEQSIKASQVVLETLGCPWSIRGNPPRPDELHRDELESNVNQPEFSQALCIGLVELLKCFGVVPSVVVGHSSGEIAAAYCAGALSQESAVKIAYYRGLLASSITNQNASAGAMIAVNLSPASIRPYLSTVSAQHTELDLVISCVNSPTNITVAGGASQIDTLKQLLDIDGVFARKLQVAVAYHSPQMNQVAEAYHSLIGKLQVYSQASNIQMVSSVTGSRISKEELCEASYWVKNMVSTVQFMDATLCLCKKSRTPLSKKLDRSHQRVISVDELVEVGPHAALQRPIQDIIQMSGRQDMGYSPTLYRNTSASRAIVKLIGYLYSLGVPINLRQVNDVDSCNSASNIVLADLPEYPFNHNKKYWHESRISTGHRLRKNGAIDLLGSPALDWNPLDPSWRYCIKTTDIPWIEDHKVNGKVIYPAAAMVVMALEAVRQVADHNCGVSGYTLRNVKFRAALEIKTGSEDAETRVRLRGLTGDAATGAPSYEFVLFSFSSGNWTENCNGTIEIQYTKPGDHRESIERLAYYHNISRSYFTIQSVSMNYMYQFLRESGLDYGTSFQCMKNASYGKSKEATATIEVFKGLQNCPESDVHVIHPTVLDSIIQLTLLALTQGGTRPMSTQVVAGIDKMWISEVTPTSRDNTMKAFTKINTETTRNTKSSFFALNETDQELRLIIEGLEISSLGSSAVSAAHTQLWCSITTMIDIDMLNASQTLEWLEKSYGPEPDGPLSFHVDVKCFLLSVLKDLLRNIQSEEIVIQKPHLKRYVAWINWQLEMNDTPEIRGQCISSGDALVSRIKDQGSVGRFFLEVARNAPGILRGDVDALQILFGNNLVNDYYSEQSFGSKYFKKLELYLDALAHKRPNMRILELGAGTGTFTNCVLHALSFHDGQKCPASRYDHYFFTDISPSFFEKAKASFSEHGHKMTFKTFDIEVDPLIQGFEEGSFDVITASNVLHVTQNLVKTIRGIRKLLKHGGKLIFHEITCPTDIKTGFAFGLLPGWWLGKEDHRAMGATVTESVWDNILRENGYSGVDFCLHDYTDELCHQMSIIVSTALDTTQSHGQMPGTKCPDTVIVVEAGSSIQSSIAENLQQRMLGVHCPSVCVVRSDEIPLPINSTALIIMLVDIETPILSRLDKNTYPKLKSVMLSGSQIIWVTKGDRARSPGFGMIEGFSRVLRIERNNLSLVTLALECAGTEIAGYTDNILHVAAEMLSTSSNMELEYVERDGILNVSRISEDTVFKSAMQERLTSQKVLTQSIELANRVKVEISIPGQLDTLKIAQCTTPYGELQADEIEVEIDCVGLNTIDSLTVLGKLSSSSLGSECSGRVTAVGRDSRFTRGDRVCMFGSNILGSSARTKQNLAAKIPDNMSFRAASIMPYDYLIASCIVRRSAALSDGETVLIHGGHISMVLATADLCLDMCHCLFISVSSDDDEKTLRKAYDSHKITILSSLYLSDQIQRRMLRKGIDVVIDFSLAGPSLDLMDCISSYGRYVNVEYGSTSPSAISLSQIPSSVTYRTDDVLSIIRNQLCLTNTPLQTLIDIAIKSRKPTNEYKVFKLSQLEAAFAVLRDTDIQRKVVIEIDKQEQLPIIESVQSTYIFDPCFTYLIAGGLGDLGMCVAEWMVQRGAKNLILLSRSGCHTEAARSMLSNMKEKGISVETPHCDITDRTILNKTLIECSNKLPPIKGCIQTSGALKDILFENMSLDDWNAAISPKVTGSWNLHELLPHGMDFFIMASSISGILGQVTQINYAAGNTYQDALARYRISKGENAVSLDLGILMTGGLLEQNHDLMERLMRTGCYIPISVKELLAMFDFFCDPKLKTSVTQNAAQIIVGIKSPIEVKKGGNDVLDVMRQPFWSHMFVSAGKENTTLQPIGETTRISTLMERAESVEKVITVITDALTQRFSRMLALPEDGLNIEEPFHANGMDSLSAVDLRNWIAKAFGVDVAVFDLLGDISINGIGQLIAKKWQAERGV